MKQLASLLLIIVNFTCLTTIAQIGIGTVNPQEDLHVAGSLRVEGTDDSNSTTALVGVDNDGTLTQLNLGPNLTIINNKLEVKANYLYKIGSKDMTTVPILGNGEVADLDLRIAAGQVNNGASVIHLNNLPQNIKLSGIKNGVDGLHLFLINNHNSRNIQIYNDDTANINSSPQNRIKVLSTISTITGNAAIELLYDGNINRWLVLSLHD